MSTDLHTCICCAYKNIFVALDILCMLLAGHMLRLLLVLKIDAQLFSGISIVTPRDTTLVALASIFLAGVFTGYSQCYRMAPSAGTVTLKCT
jgi:hypothetical protein